MPCKVERDKDGFPISFQCGPDPKSKDHECDIKGPMIELETGMGIVHTATCSICGRPAFQEWEMW